MPLHHSQGVDYPPLQGVDYPVPEAASVRSGVDYPPLKKGGRGDLQLA